MKRNTQLLITGLSLAVLVTAQGCTTVNKATKGDNSTASLSALSGKVVETMDGGGYTYLCLEKNGKKTWAAVPVMKVAVGQEMALQSGGEMTNFTSKALNKTFDKIIFSSGPVQAAGAAQPAAPATKKAAASAAAAPVLSGKVIETMNSGGYTYVNLEKDGKSGWSAIPTAEVKVGDVIELIPGIDMGSFTSATLKRTFNNIHFSAGIKGATGKAAAGKAAASDKGAATGDAKKLPQGHPSLDGSKSAASPASAAPAAKAAENVTGKVVETMNAGGYSYVCLEKEGQKIWVAVPAMKVTVGEEASFQAGGVMPNFTSKTLNKTFDKIIFSNGPATK